jgi:integrase
MASIHRRTGSPFFHGKFRDETGRIVLRSTKQTDRLKARAVVETWQAAADKARHGALTRLTVARTLDDLLERISGERTLSTTPKEYLAEWLTAKTEEGAAPASLARYKAVCAAFLGFLGERASANLRTITKRDFEAFRNAELVSGKTPKTADFGLKVIRMIFAKAHRDGFTEVDEAARAEFLKSKVIAGSEDKRGPLTDEEVRLLLAATEGTDWQGMILVAVHTGIRLVDGANLVWENFQPDEKTLKFTAAKTGKEIEVALHPEAFAWLTARQGVGAAPVFPTLYGAKAGSAGGLSNQFRRIVEKAGIATKLGSEKRGKGRRLSLTTFHGLRHTFISRLANKAISRDVRKAMAGHSSDAIHDRYTKLNVAAQHAALKTVSGFQTA